ncbi:MAG: DUF177 domain-containing protein [Lachnospiraceae bacterium]|nr:DUF177 domain-containing protein [Lachnospiraceae bacterium]
MLNLYDVLSVVGRESINRVDVEKLQANFQGENIVVTCKQPFDVTLKHIEKDVVSVSFETEVDVIRTCSRCLEEVNCEYQLSVFRNINVANKEAYIDDASEADEISYIEDCNLDVDMLVLDELYTVLPMNVICKDECKGICKVCGTNLNESTCNCDQTVPDPRMAVFSDIFNQFKEV